MLVEAEASDDKDFIALSTLMRAASSLYRMDRHRPSFLQVLTLPRSLLHAVCCVSCVVCRAWAHTPVMLQEFVKDFTVWKNSDFWEEYFLRTSQPRWPDNSVSPSTTDSLR
jgi:hypothetical protein